MSKLNKKILRDIKQNKMQFFNIFIMVFLGVFVFAGIHAYMDGMKISGDKYYEENNLQDIWITGQNFSKDDLNKIKNLKNIKEAERVLNIRTELENYKDVTLETNFIETNNISKMYVVEGEEFSKDKKGIWFDSYLAKNLNLKVGDEITLSYKEYKITEKIAGLINTPDHVYSIKDDTAIFPTHKDFGFVYLSINEFPKDYIYDELKNKYCLDNGRNAKNPILLFKYLLLKYLYNLSDNGVVERSRYDMSFKYFLELTPEEEVIHPSLLTKFRKQRLKDENILDLLINKSVELAINQGVLKSNTIIVDSTHTEARYHKTTQREMLKKASTSLKAALKAALKDSDKDIYLPDEPEKRASLDEYNEYCHELLNTVQESPYSELPTIKEESSMLSEILDNQIDCYDQSIDPDARIGHKTVNSSFYGYKTHLAMTDERIITAATITSGEAFDGQELPVLVQKSKAAGATVNEVIADTAYSTLENLKDAQSNDYKLISKLNPSIIKGTRSEDGFIFNKDADTMQCPAGHLAIKYRIDKRSNQKKNTRIKYFFDINKCHVCPYRNGCYKENAKTKTYSITIKSDYHKNQEAFQKTQYFKERFKTRYMIEAKNSELKNIHGYSRCDAAGLSNMQLQGAVSIFAVNLKRILKLKGEVCPNEEK